MHDINFNDIHITNDFMFGYVMSDEQRCKSFLEQILNVKIHHIEFLEKQKTMDSSFDARSIRLDLYVGDGTIVYDVEMQTIDRGNLPKRSRYYQSLIDADLIKKGEDYNKLKKSIVIFVCTFDLFGKSRYVYTFENICKEDPDVSLGDNTSKIFINTKGIKGALSDHFVQLMDYFNDPSVAQATNNPLVTDIDRAVKSARTNIGSRNLEPSD